MGVVGRPEVRLFRGVEAHLPGDEHLFSGRQLGLEAGHVGGGIGGGLGEDGRGEQDGQGQGGQGAAVHG